MRTYGKIKTGVKMEPYLMSKLNKSEKIQISKFRVGDHNLHMETGRHCKPKTPIDKRTCCNCNEVEDKVHFLVDCLLYDEPRVKYKLIAPHGYHDSTAKFVEILKNDEKSHNLTTFLKEAFEIRNKVCKSSK